MGFWSRMLGIDSYDAAQRVLADPYEPYMATGGIPVMDPGTPLEMLHRANVEQFWRDQPNVRKVVDYIARATASIPLHTFERVDDTRRERVTGHPLPELLGSPRPGVGAFRFWHSVLSDALLYDKYAIIKHQEGGRLQLVQVPSWRLSFRTDELRRVQTIRYWVGDKRSMDAHRDEQWVEIPLDSVIYDHGYSPSGSGLSPVETLSPLLTETAEAIRYREQVWQNGARVPAYVHRPKDAPSWDAPQRQRFVEGLRKYRSDGSAAGGWPLMEDGMEVRELRSMTSSDMLDLAGRELAAVEVASAFHIPPELVGARQGNYSNLREYRQMLYRDALGPYIDAWVQAINNQLVPDLAGDRALYVEPHIEAKLRGSFEEQAQIAQASVGAPTMTRNEYRARMNMPPIAGGDELVTPLNVLIGGQASPRDSGSQNRRSAPARAVKSAPPETHLTQHERVVRSFLERQGRSVLARLAAGVDDWWDGERWDGELADTIAGLYALTATKAGRDTLEAMGLDPDVYDEPRTQAFLREAARRSAESMNAATFDQVDAAVADDEGDPADVFTGDGALARAGVVAASVAAFAAGFGTVEAARQQAGDRASKTWRVNSGNPRSSHAALDGETVALDEDFSNGLPWPGAAGSDADEVAGCQCSVEINLP